MKLVLYIIIWLSLFLAGHTGLAQKGGGIYAENGAKIQGTIVVGNKAQEDGFGVYGKDNVNLLNCTIGNNEQEEKKQEPIKIGDIYCENKDIVSKAVYETLGRTDAAGVVFWVNSDRYAVSSRAYVAALRHQELKSGPPSGRMGIEYAVFDTACYANTMALYQGNDAARFCRDYMAGTPLAQHWLMPAGYQLACLFVARYEVEKTLSFLDGKSVVVDHFADDYWSSTENDVTTDPDVATASDKSGFYFWVVSFCETWRSSIGPGAFHFEVNDPTFWVRPILIY